MARKVHCRACGHTWQLADFGLVLPCPLCGGDPVVEEPPAPPMLELPPPDGVQIVVSDACPRGTIILNPRDAEALSTHGRHRQRFKLAEVVALTKRMLGETQEQPGDVVRIGDEDSGEVDRETIDAFLEGFPDKEDDDDADE